MITDRNSKEVTQAHFNGLLMQMEAQHETMSNHKNEVEKLQAKYTELRKAADAFMKKHGDGCGFADPEATTLGGVLERHKIKEIRAKKKT